MQAGDWSRNSRSCGGISSSILGWAFMIMIQFVDARTGENMIEIGNREWPAVPRAGDQVLFTNPVRKCRVVSATWIDMLQHHGKLIARVALEDVA
jgi:hypothetical protein